MYRLSPCTWSGNWNTFNGKCHRQLVLLAMLSVASPAMAEVAATTEFVWGPAFVVSSSGEQRQLKKGTAIHAGETVITEEARVQLRFTDGALVSLTPNAEFHVKEYSYGKPQNGPERAVMELLKGGLRTMTGLVGKQRKEDYVMQTKLATLGIRGTEYSILYGDGISGTVSSGGIAVCNAGGCLDVDKGQSYYVMDSNTRPVLTDKAVFLPPRAPDIAAAGKGDEKKAGKDRAGEFVAKLKAGGPKNESAEDRSGHGLETGKSRDDGRKDKSSKEEKRGQDPLHSTNDARGSGKSGDAKTARKAPDALTSLLDQNSHGKQKTANLKADSRDFPLLDFKSFAGESTESMDPASKPSTARSDKFVNNFLAEALEASGTSDDRAPKKAPGTPLSGTGPAAGPSADWNEGGGWNSDLNFIDTDSNKGKKAPRLK
jgi:hypothetical protein